MHQGVPRASDAVRLASGPPKNSYVERWFTVDAIDGDSRKLVIYRAQISEELGTDLDKHVTKAIDHAFKKLPVKERRD